MALYKGKTLLAGSPSLADVATSGSYNDLADTPTIDTALSSTSTNAVQNKVVNTAITSINSNLANTLFGSEAKYLGVLTQSSLNTIVNTASTPCVFSFDNTTTISEISAAGNRQFCLGWLNATKLWGWVLVCGSAGLWYGTRNNASTFTFTQVV